MKIVSIGEILFDVFPDAEVLGGAALNFAVHAGRLGHDVTFVSAVGDDERGRAARAQLRALGLRDDFLQTANGVATGVVTVHMGAPGGHSFTIHRPAAYDALRLSEEDLRRLRAMKPDWIYYGTLFAADGGARAELEKLLVALPDARRFYDINLRKGCYTAELVGELLAKADVVKMNDEEEALLQLPEAALGKCRAVAVTRGAAGCAVRVGGDSAEAPGYRVEVADTVGSGDAFAAAFLHGLSEGWSAGEVGDFANRVGALVASRRGGVPAWTIEECRALG